MTIQERASEVDLRIEAAKAKLKILLLGPGWPETELQERRALATELGRRSYNVLIMEDIQDWLTQITIIDKFHDILRRYDPQLIIGLFTKKGSPLGITFEIGYLCGFYGRGEVSRRIRFLLESGINQRKVLSSYLRKGLFESVAAPTFYPSEAADFIDSFARNRILELSLDSEKGANRDGPKVDLDLIGSHRFVDDRTKT